MRSNKSSELNRLLKTREACGNIAQEEQSLRTTVCQNEVKMSESRCRENIRSPYVASGHSATATEGRCIDLEARDMGIFRLFCIPRKYNVLEPSGHS